MPCAISTGHNKLKLLVIGKAEKPRVFKNCCLPDKGQKKGWVDRDVFADWIHHEFVPSVTKLMKSIRLTEKGLLILNNAPGHPNEEELRSDD